MQQSLTQSQTFNLSGHIISLNLRIEAGGNANQRGRPKELVIFRATDVDKNSSSAKDDEAPVLLPEYNRGTDEDSVAKLKERLHCADLRYLKLEELYQNYRLHWLEECYWVSVLEEYAPSGISTYSPRQIAWNTSSPIQRNEDDEIEDQEQV